MVATKDQVAQLIVAEAKARNHTRDECLAEMSALYQESQWNETVWGPAGKQITYGIAQQDGSYPNRFLGAAAQIRAFFDKLDAKRASPGHGDIWMNICWLQQAPNWPSAQFWFDHGRQPYLTEIKSRIATVTPYLDKYWPVSGAPAGPADVLTPMPGFRGDPYWLADVLRAEGLDVVEMDGWQQRGEGDQGVLWGMVFHHTGSPNETPEGIAFHPALGLAAHLLIRPNGTVYVCGIGKANHAGVGSWPGIATDNANPVTIGVEVAILPREGAPHREGWPAVQYDATVKTFAAILRKLAQRSDRAISHKEWAQLGPAGWRQGKWDPGAIDMNIFRGDVEAQIGTTPGGDDDMAQVPQAEWEALRADIAVVRAVVARKRPSKSIYRNPGEGDVGDMADLVSNTDAMTHQELIERLAIRYGDPDAVRRITAVAAGEGADPQDVWAVAQAKAVIEQIPAEFRDNWKDA